MCSIGVNEGYSGAYQIMFAVSICERVLLSGCVVRVSTGSLIVKNKKVYSVVFSLSLQPCVCSLRAPCTGEDRDGNPQGQRRNEGVHNVLGTTMGQRRLENDRNA